MEGFAGFAEATDCGDEKSSRPFVLVAMEEAVAGLSAELNSPKPLEALLILRSDCGGALRVLEACFGGGFGPASKNPPPLSGVDVTCGAAGPDRWLEICPKLPNDDSLGGCWGGCWGGGADDEDEGDMLKSNPLKASSNPPNADEDRAVDDCVPPIELCRLFCSEGWG